MSVATENTRFALSGMVQVDFRPDSAVFDIQDADTPFTSGALCCPLKISCLFCGMVHECLRIDSAMALSVLSRFQDGTFMQ